MEKDFDGWNELKQRLNAAEEPVYFRDGEIWWAHLGANIGYKIDGKSASFARPVIVLRKYNKHSFLALPLTTNPKPVAWKLPIGPIAGKPAFAVLSQLRNLDSRRLYQKVGSLRPDALEAILTAAFRANARRASRN